MNEFNIQGTDTVVIVKHGKIEEASTDVLVNWVDRGLRSGPKSFYNVHKKSGPALFMYTVGFESAGEADAFSTMPGMLDCRVVVHSVLPEYPTGFAKAFYNIAETVKRYKQDNLARDITLYIPGSPEMCLAGCKTFLLDIGLKTVTILYLTEGEKETIEKFFKSHQKRYSIWERIDKWVINGLISLHTKLNKKKDQTTN